MNPNQKPDFNEITPEEINSILLIENWEDQADTNFIIDEAEELTDPDLLEW